MNLSEFKAWFEGFTENISDKPTKAQWARVQKKVKSITSDPTPYPIFVDRYIQPYQRYWWGIQSAANGLAQTTGGSVQQGAASTQFNANDYSLQSFTDAGRAGALSMGASQ